MEIIKPKHIIWAGLAGAIATVTLITILLLCFKPYNYSVIHIINPSDEIIKGKVIQTIEPVQINNTITTIPEKSEKLNRSRHSVNSRNPATTATIPTTKASSENRQEVLTVEQIELMKNLENKGLLLTPQEYCNSITGYYTALITFLIGLFTVFSILSYFGIRWKAKSDIQSILEEMLDDSIKFRTKMYSALDAEFADTYVKKDELNAQIEEYTYDLRAEIKAIKSDDEQITTK